MNEKLIISDFKVSGGKHCQTTALKHILDYHGVNLSEEMLLGLGGGIGFVYWYMKAMPAPFIGARNCKPDDFVLNICKRIGAEASLVKTSSRKKGYEELKALLINGEPAYVFVDMAYLPYFDIPEEAHFGAHTINVYGLDEVKNKVYIADRCKNPVSATIEELHKARNSKYPPFPPQNKLLKIKLPSNIKDLERGIREGIRESCASMLHPRIRNFGLAGIKKWADIIEKWPKQFKGMDLFGCLFNIFIFLEIGGTGGSAFRPMYADFLEQAGALLNKPALNDAAEMFRESGSIWSNIARDALPDSRPSLRQIRELSIEKNKLFKEQNEGDIQRMRNINLELNDKLIAQKIADEFNSLEDKDIMPILTGLKGKILKLYDIENKAFNELNKLIN